MVSLSKITKKGKAMYLAYDQGLEHGPEDFNDVNVNPLKIIEIAEKGKFNGVVFHKGVVEKYRSEIKKSNVPLIMKLNGKTKLYNGEPVSSQLASVNEAIKLGASAVGFTIYIGSRYESKMMEQFELIEKEAHSKGLPVILWVYPRGKDIKDDISRENIAYAARTGLELGADIVKLKWNRNVNDLKWAVKSAGRTKVVVAGGAKVKENEFIRDVDKIIRAGAIGLAVGRNIWQSNDPLSVAEKIRKIIW